MTSVTGVKHKLILSVLDEMSVTAECLASDRRGRAADLRVIFTEYFIMIQISQKRTELETKSRVIMSAHLLTTP